MSAFLDDKNLRCGKRGKCENSAIRFCPLPPPSPPLPSSLPPPCTASSARQGDQREADKAAYRRTAANQREMLEELVPKATGKEAVMEKKFARRWVLLKGRGGEERGPTRRGGGGEGDLQTRDANLNPHLPPPLFPSTPVAHLREDAKARDASPDRAFLPGGGDMMGGDDSFAAAKAR